MAPDQKPDILASARHLLLWAREDMADIEAKWRIHFKENFSITAQNLEKNKISIYLHVKKPLPPDIEKLIHNSSNAIKHSLDQATFAIACAINKSEAEQHNTVHFPWGTTKNDVLGKLKRMKSLTEESYPLFMKLRPYKGGDDLLRDFAAAVNPAKHRIYIDAHINCANKKYIHWVTAGTYIDMKIWFSDAFTAQKDSKYLIMELENPPQGRHDYSPIFSVIFGVGTPLSGKSVHQTLAHALTKANNFIESAETWLARQSGP